MANDDGIQLLLDFGKQARRIDARKVPIDVFVNNLDERQKLSHGQIGFHSLNACALPGFRFPMVMEQYSLPDFSFEVMGDPNNVGTFSVL